MKTRQDDTQAGESVEDFQLEALVQVEYQLGRAELSQGFVIVVVHGFCLRYGCRCVLVVHYSVTVVSLPSLYWRMLS